MFDLLASVHEGGEGGEGGGGGRGLGWGGEEWTEGG